MSNEKFKSVLTVLLVLLLVAVTGCNTQQKTSDLQAGDNSLKNIKDKGTLIVGADIPYGMMEFFDESGNPQGVDVEIARRIASDIGVKLEFKDYIWENLFDAVKNGEVDFAISSITITPERANEMLFSSPYFNAGQVIVVEKDNNDINGPLDFEGKKIGVQIDSTGEEEVLKYTNSSMIITYPGYELGVETGMIYDLKTGTTDAIVLDFIAAVDIVKNEPTLMIAGEPFTQEFYGIASKTENVLLMDEVNTILRQLKSDGSLNAIIKKYAVADE
ncbi:MAG: ABC transporter substrate-binding protein [archaeon]